jgi:hypothetical protein
MQTIEVTTELEADADLVWAAMQHPTTFLYVCRGLFGVPALAGRSVPFRQGESGTGWIFAFHVLPLHRHTIELAEVDESTRTLRSHEHGGVVRAWNHTLHVEPVGERRSRYSDTVDIDAGLLTAVVARVAVSICRYRQARWRRLARKQLSGNDARTGPAGWAPCRHSDEPSGEEPTAQS